MRIDKKLNLVIPVEWEEGEIYVHSTPISRNVFSQFFLVISKTFASIFSQGLGAIAGPRIAYLLLKKTAEDMGAWVDVSKGLINEIVRLTNIAMPGEKGWDTIPLQTAINKKLLDEDTIDEVMGALVFFTCTYTMQKKTLVEPMMEAANSLWGSQIVSLSFTEFKDSLPTLTVTETSSAKPVKQSSLPS